MENVGDGDGWRGKDHDHVLHVFDNGTDANNADNDLGQVTFQLP